MNALKQRLFPGAFPWKLFVRYIAVQGLILLVALFIAGVQVQNVAILSVSFILFSAWMGQRLFYPLGRLIERATSQTDLAITDSELTESQAGEWDDLENALNRIRTDLQRNATALDRERDELGILMGSISDAILAVDAESRLLFYNSRFAVLFKSREIDLKRSVLSEVFRNPEILEAFHGALHEKRPQEATLQLHPKNESGVRHFSLAVTPLRNEGSGIYGAVGVFHDVTELKRAERMRIDFVANVSHELRTPLTAIKGFTDTLASDARAGRFEMVPKYLDVIVRNVDRLMALIEDLLDLSSLDSGVEFEKVPVETREATERVLAQLESKRLAKRQQIETGFEVETVSADPRRLEQVLVNIIDNAMKYVPEGGRIRIDWKASAGSVSLIVQDNGPGIPLESVERLFERFYRVDKARSREIGGTGLGLAIVKHVMQRHGGSVTARSELGKGSEFICEFPAN